MPHELSGEYWDFLGSRDLILLVESLAVFAAETKDPIARTQYIELRKQLQRKLTSLAASIARLADQVARKTVEAKRSRPETQREHPHLVDLIESEPFPGGATLGAVGIGRIKTLSEHPGWWVQEEGSREIYPDFVGRLIYGAFFGGAQPEKPRAAYAGVESPPHGRFVPGGLGVNGVGAGEIRDEIEGKHYLQAGSNAAKAKYVAEIAAIGRTYSARAVRIAEESAARTAAAPSVVKELAGEELFKLPRLRLPGRR